MTHKIIGTKQGQIWQGIECQKEFEVSFNRNERHRTLRGYIGAILADGDFAGRVKLSDAVLITEMFTRGRWVKKARALTPESNPTIADCFTA